MPPTPAPSQPTSSVATATENNPADTAQQHIDQQWQSIQSTIAEAQKLAIPNREHRAKRLWISEATWELIEQRQQARAQGEEEEEAGDDDGNGDEEVKSPDDLPSEEAQEEAEQAEEEEEE